MPKQMVRVELDDGVQTTVTADYAESHQLKVLDGVAAVDKSGRTLPALHPVSLRGKELDEALTDAGLSTAGKLAEKQSRLAAHQASAQASPGGGTSTTTTAGNGDPS